LKPANRQIFRLFEDGFVIIALLLLTGFELSLRVTAPGVSADEGNLLGQVINLFNCGVFFFFLTLRAKRAASVASRELLLWMLLLLACCSVTWSPVPAMTLRRSVALVATTGVGLYLATRYTIGEQVRLLAKALLLAAVVSLAVIVLWPERGVYGSEGGFRGIWYRGLYENKNVLGRLMALGAVSAVCAFFESERRLFWSCGFLLCLGMLALTRSGTSIVVFAVTLGSLPVLMLLRWNYRLALLLIGSAMAPGGLVIAWLWTNAETAFSLLGKDTTFTGRVDIWMAVMDMIWKRPWLGYGFGGFWRGWEGPSAYVSQIAGWEVPHSHNGFLDLWLALGVWGLALFVVWFTIAFFRALAAMVHSERVGEGIWPVVYFLFTVLYNLTESTILRPHSIFWMLFVAAVFSRPTKIMKGPEPDTLPEVRI
jgi:O-antigen ligase